MDAIFSIDYDEQGSNGRAIQELAIIQWRDYLQDCESMFQIDRLTRPFRVLTHWMPHVSVHLIHIQKKTSSSALSKETSVLYPTFSGFLI